MQHMMKTKEDLDHQTQALHLQEEQMSEEKAQLAEEARQVHEEEEELSQSKRSLRQQANRLKQQKKNLSKEAGADLADLEATAAATGGGASLVPAVLPLTPENPVQARAAQQTFQQALPHFLSDAQKRVA